MSVLWIVHLLSLIAERGASTEHISPEKDGDLCTIGDRSGKWTDVSECLDTGDFVRISAKLFSVLDDDDIMVCCEHRNIEACPADERTFVTTRIDASTAAAYVQLEKECAKRPQRFAGDQCTINDEEGAWTYEKECPSSAGCCKPKKVSTQKCLQYAAYTSGEPRHQAETSFLAEIFNRNRIGICGGVLVSEQFVLTSCLDVSFAKYVRIGIINSTPFITTPIVLSVNICPACLPHHNDLDGISPTILGFGWNDRDLLKINATLMNTEECLRMFVRSAAGQNFCVQRNRGVPCTFKPGAVLIDRNYSSVVTGIGSTVFDCTKHLFVRISAFVPWIEEIVWR